MSFFVRVVGANNLLEFSCPFQRSPHVPHLPLRMSSAVPAAVFRVIPFGSQHPLPQLIQVGNLSLAHAGIFWLRVDFRLQNKPEMLSHTRSLFTFVPHRQAPWFSCFPSVYSHGDKYTSTLAHSEEYGAGTFALHPERPNAAKRTEADTWMCCPKRR